MHPLIDLATHLLKVRDKTQSFVSLSFVSGCEYVATYAKRTVSVFISPDIVDSQPLEEYVIFAENSKKNVDKLVANWDAYIASPNLAITFVNSVSGAYWSIKPAIHAKIGTKKSVYSLFEASESSS